jgi:hypothetical protein
MNILFFSPYSGIWVHSRAEALVAEELVNDGHNVHILRCDGILKKHCPVMTAYGQSFHAPDAKKNKICATCKSNTTVLDTNTNITTSKIEDYISINQIDEINSAIKAVTIDNFETFTIDGLQIGRYATYEILLTHKISCTSQLKGVWNEYLENLRQCYITQKIIDEFLKNNKIDRVVVYNSFYSLNRTAVKVAESRGIPWSTIHGGKNVQDMLQTLTVSSSDAHDLLLARSVDWRTWKDVPLKAEEIAVVKNNIKFIFSSKSAFTYSKRKKNINPAALRGKLNVGENQKVLLCILSSADERFAADFVDALDFKMTSTNTSIFLDTHEWLTYLIDFIEKHKEFHLIIRAHPRMFPNHRESVQSQAGIELLKLSEKKYERVSWDFPQDKTSLYDLAEITDVVLNGTSTAGIELMSLGLPVVIYDADKLFAYPQEFNYVGATLETYENSILEAAQDGRSLENSIRAFRYRSFLFNVVTLSLHDAIPSRTKWSLDRILDGLSNRKGLPVPVALLKMIRKREIAHSSVDLVEKVKVVRAILENVSTVAELVKPSKDRSGTEERTEILLSLKEIAREYMNTQDDKSLGTSITNEFQAYSEKL